MVLLILGGVFVISLLIGVPIAFCLGLCSLAVVLIKENTLSFSLHKRYSMEWICFL